jgi:hypothetical protein
MPRRFPGDSITDLMTEVGFAMTDSSGQVIVNYSTTHYSNINILLTPDDDSFNIFLINKTATGFTAASSVPDKRFTYKVISTRA